MYCLCIGPFECVWLCAFCLGFLLWYCCMNLTCMLHECISWCLTVQCDVNSRQVVRRSWPGPTPQWHEYSHWFIWWCIWASLWKTWCIKNYSHILSRRHGSQVMIKSLDEKLKRLWEIMYSQCLCEFGGSERKEVTSPQKTRWQRQIEVLTAW